MGKLTNFVALASYKWCVERRNSISPPLSMKICRLDSINWLKNFIMDIVRWLEHATIHEFATVIQSLTHFLLWIVFYLHEMPRINYLFNLLGNLLMRGLRDLEFCTAFLKTLWIATSIMIEKIKRINKLPLKTKSF